MTTRAFSTRSAAFSVVPLSRFQGGDMPVSDVDLITAWKQVLTLSRVSPGDVVTVLTSTNTHPQTMSTAIIAAAGLGAVVNRLDVLPVNGEKSLSRDSLGYVGTTPLTGNRAALSALKSSTL